MDPLEEFLMKHLAYFRNTGDNHTVNSEDVKDFIENYPAIITIQDFMQWGQTPLPEHPANSRYKNHSGKMHIPLFYAYARELWAKPFHLGDTVSYPMEDGSWGLGTIIDIDVDGEEYSYDHGYGGTGTDDTLYYIEPTDNTAVLMFLGDELHKEIDAPTEIDETTANMFYFPVQANSKS